MRKIGSLLFVFVLAVGWLGRSAEDGFASIISDTPDGNVWGVDSDVFAVVRAGSTIYVGGTFSNVVSRNGLIKLPANRLAAFNVFTGQPTTWRPSIVGGGGVYALAVSPDGNTIYAGGTFAYVNGVPCGGFAALSTLGTVLWSVDANATVRSLTVSGDTIYLGGFFTRVQGATRYALAAVKAPLLGGTKGVVQPWNAGVTWSKGKAGVYGMAVANGDLVAVGIFDKANGQWQPNQARFDITNGWVKSWAYHEPVWTRSVATDGRNFYGAVAGHGGKVVAWGPQGGMLWRKAGNGDVQAIASCAGQIIAGGHFTKFDGFDVIRLMAMDPATGTIDTSWAPNPDEGDNLGVWSICPGPNKLHVGGAFRNVNTTLVRGYAQFSFPVASALSAVATQSDELPTAASTEEATESVLAWIDSWRLQAIGYDIYRDGEWLTTLDALPDGFDAILDVVLPDNYDVERYDENGNIFPVDQAAIGSAID